MDVAVTATQNCACDYDEQSSKLAETIRQDAGTLVLACVCCPVTFVSARSACTKLAPRFLDFFLSCLSPAASVSEPGQVQSTDSPCMPCFAYYSNSAAYLPVRAVSVSDS